MDAVHAVVILLGAGAGRRLGATEPKAFLPIGGRPILAVAAAGAGACPDVRSFIVTVPAGWEEHARHALADLDLPVQFVPGGASREGSVRAALAHVRDDVPVVVVHDAARPFASPDLFSRVLHGVRSSGDGAVPVLPVTDTLIRLRDGVVADTEPRDQLSISQTPQAFRTQALREAHAAAEAAGASFTDDATLLHWAGFQVRAVPGDATNGKITTLADLAEADRRMGGVSA